MAKTIGLKKVLQEKILNLYLVNCTLTARKMSTNEDLSNDCDNEKMQNLEFVHSINFLDLFSDSRALSIFDKISTNFLSTDSNPVNNGADINAFEMIDDKFNEIAASFLDEIIKRFEGANIQVNDCQQIHDFPAKIEGYQQEQFVIEYIPKNVFKDHFQMLPKELGVDPKLLDELIPQNVKQFITEFNQNFLSQLSKNNYFLILKKIKNKICL